MRILAAFPGTGRHDYIAQYPNMGYINPPLYPWNHPIRHAEVILHRTVQRQAARGLYSLVTPHVRTLRELDKLQLGYLMVLPDPSLKEEYQARYLAATGNEGGAMFANYMASMWDRWLYLITTRAHPRYWITLQSGETLLDRVPFHQDPDYFEGYKGVDNTDPCSVG